MTWREALLAKYNISTVHFCIYKLCGAFCLKMRILHFMQRQKSIGGNVIFTMARVMTIYRI